MAVGLDESGTVRADYVINGLMDQSWS